MKLPMSVLYMYYIVESGAISGITENRSLLFSCECTLEQKSEGLDRYKYFTSYTSYFILRMKLTIRVLYSRKPRDGFQKYQKSAKKLSVSLMYLLVQQEMRRFMLEILQKKWSIKLTVSVL